MGTLDKEILKEINGLVNDVVPSASTDGLPWSTGNYRMDSEEKSFFPPYEIKGDRWDKLFPYRLLVIDVSTPGKYRPVPLSNISSDNSSNRKSKGSLKTIQANGMTSYVINQETLSGNWEVRLPITPQRVQIIDQFAINTTATMRGIVEEHNGAKFKIINLAGTTGIWPLKGTISGEVKGVSSINSIFAGTLEDFDKLVADTKRVKNAFTGKHPSGNPQSPEVKDLSQTGYFQLHYLKQFLERYSQAKRRPENKGWRLVLDIPKDNQTFIVTPLRFVAEKSAQNPQMINYNMQFKAWKRIDLDDVGLAKPEPLIRKYTPSNFQRIVNTITEARRVLSSASNLIKSVRSDAQAVFNVIRQVALAYKDLTGVILSMAELPGQLVNDLKTEISNAYAIAVSAGGGLNAIITETKAESQLAASANLIKTSSGAAKVGKLAAAIYRKTKANEGLTEDQVKSGALGDQAADALNTDPINNVFDNQEEYFDFFNNITLDDVNLNPRQEEAIQLELEKNALLTINDFREFKKTLISLSSDLANSFGAGNQVISDIYGTPDPKYRPIPMSIEENEVISAIWDIVQALDLLTATKFYDQIDTESPLQYVGGLAANTNIAFEDFQSKIPMPVPFGLTIEEIAMRYMGDPDKWIEIVTLNNLRSPYIDEEGYYLSFESNGSGRQFVVTDPEERLYIGQKIFLLSDTIAKFTRKIIDLKDLGDNKYLVIVDKEADLDILKVSENARMQGFLPGTVNSQNQILIPVNEPADEDDLTFEIPGISDDSISKISKVDFLLDDSGDLVLSDTGDFKLASGLTNLIQAMKLKLKTEAGSLLRHLDYGSGLQAGVSVADIERGNIIDSLNKMIEDDTRFESIERITVKLDGTKIELTMAIRLASQTGILPITVNIPAI